MMVKYEQTIEDLVEFRVFHSIHSRSYRQMMLYGRIAASFLIIIAGLAVFALFNRPLTPWVYLFVLILGIAGFVKLSSGLPSRLKQGVRKMLNEGDNQAVLGPQSLTASPEGLLWVQSPKMTFDKK